MSTKSTFTTKSGQLFIIRALDEQDEVQLADFLHHVDGNDVRMRFFASIRAFDHRFLWPLVHYNHRLGIALVALEPATDKMLGIARLHCSAPASAGEFAILVRSDLHHQGLGLRLMRQLLLWARQHDVLLLYGEVLRANHPMLDFCHRLGFRRKVAKEDPSLIHVELDLRAPMPD